ERFDSVGTMTTQAREIGTPLAVPTWTWALLIVLAPIDFYLGWLWLGPGIGPRPWIGIASLVLGCFSLVRAWWLATLRAYVTSEGVVVGRRRRRTIPWQDVRAIEEQRRFWLADLVVVVIPVVGEPATVMTKATWRNESYDWHRR